MKLRPYQLELIEKARAEMKRGVRSIMIQAPTGAGKTALTTQMLKSASEKGMRSWFLNHRRELIKQSSKAFHKGEVHHGIVAAGFPEDKSAPVQIASIQTIYRRLDRYKAPQLIVWDEAHHLAAGTWEKIFHYFPNAFHVGLSATPCRTDGRGLGDYFDSMIEGPSVAWLINNGYLADYKLFAPASGISTAGIHTRMGEFVQSELQAAVDKPTITGNIIGEYKKRCMGKRAIGFAVSIEHSQHLVAQFNLAGIPAAHVDGDTDSELRDLALQRFEKGDLLALFNVSLFGEGLDIPCVEALIDVAPTQSMGLWLQRCGRVLRPSPGKDFAVILDHGQNVMRHGLPDDHREWSLHSAKATKRDPDNANPVKICPQCFGAQSARNPRCEYCGLVFVLKVREVEQVEGDLVEIDRELLREKNRADQGQAKTLEELIELGKQRKYKRPYLWAKHVFAARKKGGK